MKRSPNSRLRASLLLCLMLLGVSALPASAQTWTLLHETNFGTAPNTAAVGAGVVLYDGLRDISGGQYSIASGVLTYAGTTQGFLAYNTGTYSARDQREVVTSPPNVFATNAGALYSTVRWVTPNTAYFGAVSYSGTIWALTVYTEAAGVFSIVSSVQIPTPSATHAYSLDVSAVGAYPTTINAVITDVTAGTTFYTAAPVTDSTAALQSGSGFAYLGNLVDGKIYALAAPTVPPIPVTDANWYWSPYNWYGNGTGALQANNVGAGSTFAVSNNVGAYDRVGFSGTTAALNVDVSALVGAAASAAAYPVLWYTVDGGPVAYSQLTAGTTSVNCTPAPLAAGTHVLRSGFDFSSTVGRPDRWTTPVEAVRITGLALDAGAATLALSGPDAPLAGNALFLGDSLRESYWANNTYSAGDTLLTPVAGVAAAFGCNYGTVAFGGQGLTVAGTSGVPALPSSWPYYSAGRSRLVGGLLSPAPAYVFADEGTNDFLQGATDAAVSAAFQTVTTGLRAAAPSAKIVWSVPPGGFKAAALLAGFQTYQGGAASVTSAVTSGGVTVYKGTGDPNCFLLNLGAAVAQGFGTAIGAATFASVDGIHPVLPKEEQIGSALAQGTQQAAGVSGGGSGAGLTDAAVQADVAAALSASRATLAAAVWDEPAASHTAAGSFGPFVFGLPTATLSTIKGDSRFSMLLNHILEKYSYAPGTHTLTVKGDDGSTLGSVVVSVDGLGNITGRQ